MTLASKTGQVTFRQKGDRGMMPYPAGEYSSTVTYVATANTAPYVLLSGTYYVMNKVGSWLGTSTGKTPAQDYAANGKNATWIPFENYKAIYVELLMANFGKIASAVFSGEFMFSQQGKNAAGAATSDYSKFGTSEFTPNLMLDFETGKIIGDKCELSGSIKRGITIYESGAWFQITPKSNIYVIKNTNAQNLVFLFFSLEVAYWGTEFSIINGGSGVAKVSYALENPFFLFKGKHYTYVKLNKPGDIVELVYSPVLSSLHPDTGGVAFIIRNKSDFKANADGITLESI